jgi:hypothetical protein
MYTINMNDNVKNILLEDAVNRDRTTARRVALVEILLKERYLTREQLITRVEGRLEKGCFGDCAWEDTFFRDMQVVKQALRAAGYQPAYSRSSGKSGYYLRDQAVISSDLERLLDSCVLEVNPSQIEIFKKLTFAQRFQQGCSISNLARDVVAHRIRQRNPHLITAEAQRLAVQGRKEA